jgi:hypothetical protein
MLQFPSAGLGLGASMLNLSKHHLQQQYYAELIQQLIDKHTLKIWSLICSFVLLTGALAAVGLLNPGYDPTDAQLDASTPGLTSQPLPSNPQNVQRSTKTWKMGLLLLVSTVGSGAIAYHLKYADWSPQPPSRPTTRATKVKRKSRPKTKAKTARTAPPKAHPPRNSSPRRSARSQTPAPRIPRSPARPAAGSSERTKSLPTPRSRTSGQLQPAIPPNPNLAAEGGHSQARAFKARERVNPHRQRLVPEIAVVPAETVMPLDRREPTLAELLDLRKRYPIASIIKEMKET